MGLTFPNVLGLAAGFDKNAVGIDALAALGFGHVEIGTVTGEPQPGNEKPRLFRLPDDRAVVNRMGFNNDGAEVVARRLHERARDLDKLDRRGSPPVLGVNIGKTKVVPEDQAVGDYEKSARLLAPYADYLVVNVSSPNTPGLRNLQAVEKLEPLLAAVRATADDATDGRRVPLLVKIAPDLDDDDVLAVADLATALGLDGIIATNTTISRDGLATPSAEVERIGAGGLSGRPAHPALAGGAPAAEGPGRRRSRPGLGRRHHHGRRRPRPARRRRRPCSRATPRSSTRARCGRGGSCRVSTSSTDVRPAGMTLAPRGPVHVTGEVLASKRVGAYRHLTLVAPGIPERFRPGTFVALSVGDPAGSPGRAMWIHRVKPTGGYGATVELVVEPRRPRHRVAGRPARSAPGSRSPGRSADRSRCRRSAVSLRPRRRGVRRRPALPAGRAAARARVRGHPASSPAPTRRTCCPPWRPGARPARSPSSPPTARSGATGPWRT